jgi:hypothetical protein
MPALVPVKAMAAAKTPMPEARCAGDIWTCSILAHFSAQFDMFM